MSGPPKELIVDFMSDVKKSLVSGTYRLSEVQYNGRESWTQVGRSSLFRLPTTAAATFHF